MEHISKVMNNLPVNQEQAPAVHKPSKIGETHLQIALKSGLIKNDTEGLMKVLKYVMLLVGMRANNLPDDLEKQVLINFIQSNYGGHTVSEIRLAFELAINGQLELKTEDVKSYENFSVLYFSTIMNAYRIWSAQEYKQTIKEPPPAQRIFTEQELDDQWREDVEMFYQRLLRGWQPEVIPDYFKAILVKDGLMKQEEDIVQFFITRGDKEVKNIYVKA